MSATRPGYGSKSRKIMLVSEPDYRFNYISFEFSTAAIISHREIFIALIHPLCFEQQIFYDEPAAGNRKPVYSNIIGLTGQCGIRRVITESYKKILIFSEAINTVNSILTCFSYTAFCFCSSLSCFISTE